MLPDRIARGVIDGRVDLAFRRWERPRVRAGSQFRSHESVIEVTSIDEVEKVTAPEAVRAGFDNPAAALSGLRDNGGRLFRIGLRCVGDDPRVALRDDAHLTDDEVGEIVGRLDRFDVRSRRGPWTRAVLTAIAAEPGVRAGDLAAGLGREVPDFKLDVRKLKGLGLTESLPVGYRLSPRGEVVLARLAAVPD